MRPFSNFTLLSCIISALASARRLEAHPFHRRYMDPLALFDPVITNTNNKTLPSFANCINYQILPTPISAASQCARICIATSFCKFFAVYNTPTSSSDPYCGWWNATFTAAQFTEKKTDLGEAISNAYGYQRINNPYTNLDTGSGSSSVSVGGASTSAAAGTTKSSTTATKSTTVSATSPSLTKTSSVASNTATTTVKSSSTMTASVKSSTTKA